jgi:acyl-CoA synthetase (NDP forming)
MARAALLLTEQPLPRGRRVGILSNAGGIGILAADATDLSGLVVPEFSARLREQLREHMSGTVGTSNPVDLGAGAEPDHLARAMDALLASGEVDVLLVALVATRVSDATLLLPPVAAARRRHPLLPVVLVAMGGLPVTKGDVPGLTVFDAPEEAIESIAYAVRYAEWREVPREDLAPVDHGRASIAASYAHEVLAGSEQEAPWLGAGQVAELLALYGLRPLGDLVCGPGVAAKKATNLGFPVAVKVADASVVHKTERGLVRVGLLSAPEVAAAVRQFQQELDRDDVPVLVQPVVAGVEIALGVVRDAGFGPLVMVAAGGVATGVLHDRVFLLPPVTRRDAARALRALRIWPLLDGYRGSDRVAVADLEQLIVTVSELAHGVPEVAELDLNPVVATPQGVWLVDAKVRLAAGDRLNDGVPRQLRAPG